MTTRRPMGALEDEIMAYLWAAATPATPAEVHQAVAPDLAYTTVMTTVSRLHNKGLLERKRDGRRYLYQARYSQEELAQAMASEVLDCLGPGSQQAAMALLVDRVSRADVAELERLEQMIRERREVLKRG